MPLGSAIADLKNAACGGVFIDDTGSPGLVATPGHLHPKRKTWVAVIVPRHQIAEIMEQFPRALSELGQQVGATEFHFTEIYQGTKQFEKVPFKLRMALFGFMAHIFNVYQFPVLVQTLDPDNKAVELFRQKFPERLGAFDLRSHEDLALFLLFIRTKWLLRDEMDGQSVRLFLDAGRFKAGSSVVVPGLDPPFINGEIISADSSLLHPIQLADFAAFGLNRVQLLLGRYDLNIRDKQLLEVFSSIAWNYKNLTVTPGSTDQWPPFSETELVAIMQQASQALDPHKA
jgi:hypothetical protein